METYHIRHIRIALLIHLQTLFFGRMAEQTTQCFGYENVATEGSSAFAWWGHD